MCEIEDDLRDWLAHRDDGVATPSPESDSVEVEDVGGEVANGRTESFNPEKHIRVDRKTRWGNKYVLGKDGTREEVVMKFAYDLVTMEPDTRRKYLQPIWQAILEGKRLWCWCSPELCHGMVLVYVTLNEWMEP